MTSISAEVIEGADEIVMLVTEHFQPGKIAQLFGSKPYSKTTTWHGDKWGIMWRNDEGQNELRIYSIPYDCQELYEQWKFRKSKYGPTLA